MIEKVVCWWVRRFAPAKVGRHVGVPWVWRGKTAARVRTWKRPIVGEFTGHKVRRFGSLSIFVSGDGGSSKWK
jgi:hypothetical protein